MRKLISIAIFLALVMALAVPPAVFATEVGNICGGCDSGCDNGNDDVCPGCICQDECCSMCLNVDPDSGPVESVVRVTGNICTPCGPFAIYWDTECCVIEDECGNVEEVEIPAGKPLCIYCCDEGCDPCEECCCDDGLEPGCNEADCDGNIDACILVPECVLGCETYDVWIEDIATRCDYEAPVGQAPGNPGVPKTGCMTRTQFTVVCDIELVGRGHQPPCETAPVVADWNDRVVGVSGTGFDAHCDVTIYLADCDGVKLDGLPLAIVENPDDFVCPGEFQKDVEVRLYREVYDCDLCMMVLEEVDLPGGMYNIIAEDCCCSSMEPVWIWGPALDIPRNLDPGQTIEVNGTGWGPNCCGVWYDECCGECHDAGCCPVDCDFEFVVELVMVPVYCCECPTDPCDDCLPCSDYCCDACEEEIYLGETTVDDCGNLIPVDVTIPDCIECGVFVIEAQGRCDWECVTCEGTPCQEDSEGSRYTPHYAEVGVVVGPSIQIVRGLDNGTFFILGSCMPLPTLDLPCVDHCYPGYDACDLSVTWDGCPILGINLSERALMCVDDCCDPTMLIMSLVPEYATSGVHEVCITIDGIMGVGPLFSDLVIEECATFTVTDGTIGPCGPAGADGVDGKDGVDGQDGQDGVDGQDGQDGQDGADGAQGPKGDTGAQGPQGPQGIQGEPGPAGSSGNDTAAANHVDDSGSNSAAAAIAVIAGILAVIAVVFGGIVLNRARRGTSA